MKYLAVLNSTAFEVLFRTVCWATVGACHSSYNKLCYVTVTAGLSHRRRPIHAHIDSAKRVLVLKRAGKSDWMHDEKPQSGLECFTTQIICFDKNIIAMHY